MTEIVIQADLGGMSIAFTEQVSGSAGEASVNEQLDRFTKAIVRQRSRFNLGEKLVDLLTSKGQLASNEERMMSALATHEKVLPSLLEAHRQAIPGRFLALEKERDDALKSRAEDRIKINTAFPPLEGRRLERPKSKLQFQAEHQNDLETQQIRDKYARDLEDLKTAIAAEEKNLREKHATDMQKLREDYETERRGYETKIPMLEVQIMRLRDVIAGRDPTEPLEAECMQLVGEPAESLGNGHLAAD